MRLRESFPAAGSDYLGGESDGYEYHTTFSGSSLRASYDIVISFLQEEGYGDIPIPKDLEELVQFRLSTRNKQILLFDDNVYCHNPVKILFPLDRRKRRTILLYIYNENDSNHLLKFHKKFS